MSIMDMFKTKPAESSTPATQSQNNSNGTGNDLKPVPNENKETSTNPLDSYTKMFDNTNNENSLTAPSFKLDSKVVDEVAGKMNFTQNLDPAIVQKAMQGDAQAFMQAIQSASQNAYKAAIQHNTSLTDTFINQRSEYEKKQINQGVHREMTNQALSSAPNFSHPVIKQELNRVADQFARANPDASPVEVAEAAKKYITDLSTALNPSTSKDEKNDGEMDWSKYLAD